ncbi:hypothetical protein K2173_021171 [Erythroxylum novogranatense]|uniref:Auxin-responsive protein n=1 Tax=Erythroxylum novogranatense TaxID=1862640 RepID=A0AAV8TMU1_9ROSI|nr:hypothetical protein K2173_021171 [Erythroxylum novogranatense]
MELQLGLALPTVHGVSASKGGLNFQGYSPSKELVVSGIVKPECCAVGVDDDEDNSRSRKRGLQDAFQELRVVPRTLPLFFWDKQPNDNEEEDDDDDDDDFAFAINRIDDEEGEGIVGWPPIKFRRKKAYQFSQSKNRSEGNSCVDCRRSLSNSKYVKVKMEGVAIARKINLSLYSSIPVIKQTLFAMFGIREEKWSSYELTFQDTDGDWLIPEDWPWRTFIGSVQRLKLVKTSN